MISWWDRGGGNFASLPQISVASKRAAVSEAELRSVKKCKAVASPPSDSGFIPEDSAKEPEGKAVLESKNHSTVGISVDTNPSSTVDPNPISMPNKEIVIVPPVLPAKEAAATGEKSKADEALAEVAIWNDELVAGREERHWYIPTVGLAKALNGFRVIRVDLVAKAN
jgi:hypothetical protein